MLRVDSRIICFSCVLLVRKKELLPELCLYTEILKVLANVRAFSFRKALEQRVKMHEWPRQEDGRAVEEELI